MRAFGKEGVSKVIFPADFADAADFKVEIFEKKICSICEICGK